MSLTAFGQLFKVWRSKVSLKTKLGFYNAAVISTLLYGSETWVTTYTEEKRLEVLITAVPPYTRHKVKKKKKTRADSSAFASQDQKMGLAMSVIWVKKDFLKPYWNGDLRMPNEEGVGVALSGQTPWSRMPIWLEQIIKIWRPCWQTGKNGGTRLPYW